MKTVQRNNGRVPQCGYMAFLYFFGVISVVGIGAFTVASVHSASTAATNVMNHQLSGGATSTTEMS